MADAESASWLWFVLASLAVWRVTHLVHLEHGPWGVIAKARSVAQRIGLGELAGCFFCLSLWTAAPAALWLATDWPSRVVAWLALSAAAILIETRGLRGPSARTPTDEER
jgi:hypothetical protein